MKLRMDPGHKLGTDLKCNYCKRSVSRHKSDCPMLAYEEAQHKLLRYTCPACKDSAVDVNDSDYYECRSCHRQFSRAAHHEGEGSRLFLQTADDILPVVELPEHGKGNFPAWEVFYEARKRLEQIDSQAK